MSFSFLTGSEILRDKEILQNWLIFEPISNQEFAVSGGVYSVPIGQDVPADYVVYSGSLQSSGSYIEIEKVRRVFDRESDANEFLLNVGIENVVSYYERNFIVRPGTVKIQYVIETINHPNFEIEIVPKNFEISKGFRVSVYKEDDQKLEQLSREIVEDLNIGILSEPFLRYFDLKDKK
jgi:hypothetical protein